MVWLSACARGATGGAPAPGPARGQVVVSGGDTIVLIGPPTVVDTLPAVAPGRFDTGKMWTFENPPLDYFQQEYGFRPSAQWLERVRLAALRLPNCTASFVSPNGLVMSNHHCARESATAVSQEGEDLLTNGFYAATQADERRVPDLYVDQLVVIRDVTAEVQAGIPATGPEEQQVAARDQKIEEVAERLSGETGLRCDVTSLYHGGKYSSYCYRRYDDVRLVFAPETQIGYFGGDYDNFTYPRYDLDVSFFRVYGPDGQSFQTQHYLTWSDSGAAEGSPVFVIGNPGSTSRLNTVAQLEYRRDHQYPSTIRLLESRAGVLDRYIARHPDQRSTYINDYFSYTNSLKAYTGELKGLRTPELMARKVAFEKAFQAAVRSDSALRRQYGSLWDEIARLRRQIADVAPRVNALNQGGSLRSQTLATALGVLQYAQAATSGMVPDSVLEAFRAELLATEINRELDAMILTAQIEDAVQLLGPDDPFVRDALQGRGVEAAATSIVNPSVLPDSARRAALLANPADLATTPDPAIRLMRSTLPRLRAAFQEFQRLTDAEEVRTSRLARALFDVYGAHIPPDATFTLRIADGVVKGYQYNGTIAPVFTTFYGLYDRHFSHAGRPDWALPDRWRQPPAGFNLATPLNFVTTNDIIGGNSGSPVINAAGQLVGLIFDGNIESLPGDFIYTTETNRAIAVHSAGILEALRHVYGATRIVTELEATRR
ncbi:MAG: S46 family peptidase [Gemmatimonadetes bacterium]|nr:S46 family peptidase [Gemmatimonadota bacterium]